MTSLFRKVNTLVRAQINDLLDFDQGNKRRKRRETDDSGPSQREIRRGLQGDVTNLRKRLNEALEYEDQLQARIDSLYKDISEWDHKADLAVSEGRETDARFALGRLQQAQRELEMAESALREHRIASQELISKVSMLESVVEQAQREQEAAAENQRQAEDSSQQAERVGRQITERMDDARQQLSDLIARRGPSAMPEEADIIDEVPQPPSHPIDQKAVEDDLAARRARLSKPPKSPDTKAD